MPNRATAFFRDGRSYGTKPLTGPKAERAPDTLLRDCRGIA